MTPDLAAATHLVSAADGATALCEPCAHMFTRLMSLLNADNEVYALQDQDEPHCVPAVLCQLVIGTCSTNTTLTLGCCAGLAPIR